MYIHPLPLPSIQKPLGLPRLPQALPRSLQVSLGLPGTQSLACVVEAFDFEKRSFIPYAHACFRGTHPRFDELRDIVVYTSCLCRFQSRTVCIS